ncbi:ATP-dependent helicase HrpB [Plebeiibacterium sediminum]|uniref:ATP-dependent helicase HrpB n=1 Tax=Plebeiibacterium sediminum TaxID=2992112 RepID=A0AAE3SG16_9BACT|nr:ATP-dependent helicase HrpB [Plebeiobacterium sediminum]MCW3788008.1 ATP-dependent helicase HrpB [Plebeiobacterium sediminum]
MLSLDPYKIDLPVVAIFDEVKAVLKEENTLIVNAPAGAGKSTLLPLVLMNEDWLQGKKIIMLEPRRLAAKTIALRMAQLLNEKVGESVGYRIRFDNCVSDKTKIEVVTEGILTRMLQSDNAIENVGLVIFDEFHERSLFADVALALARESQQVLRPDLRLMVMSATLNLPVLSSLLKSRVVQSEGRQYPVEIKYDGDTDLMMLPELSARLVKKIIQNEDGDVLVFLPGEGEIKKCETILKRTLKGVLVYPLYGQLPPSKQMAAIMPNREGKRKVVLATSIAETSLTIEGIKVVVDCGLSRTMRFNPSTALSKLETVEITKDAADQRAGRAGRLSPGVCYRMWTKATHSRLREHRTPEIIEADLASLVLDLAVWGISNPNNLIWLTPPPKGAIAQATDLLHQLEALEDGRITSHGKAINQLPCHPRIAHMLIMAQEEGLTELATDIAAILEERDPLGKEAGIDINLRIEALRKSRKGLIGNKILSRIEKVAGQYRKMLNVEIDNSNVDPYETGLLLVYAYPERIAHAKPGNNAQFKMANGAITAAGHKDDLAHEAWLAVAHVNMRDSVGKIFTASALNPRDLAPMVKEKDQVEWDTKRGGFSAVRNLCVGHIILQSKPLQYYDEALKIKAISSAVSKEGENLLNWDKEVIQWQNRVLSLRKWNTDEDWPDVSTSALLESNEEWLSPYFNSVKKPEDLKKINLKEVLQHHLSFEKQQLLEELAPEKIEVPTGSKIKIQYHANGEVPVLPVRLQEIFGWQDTPTVNKGKVSLLMHLLSPGFKPVQITGDLRSFWSNAYFEVKKELKARYPKHKWPDDPLNEKPNRK